MAVLTNQQDPIFIVDSDDRDRPRMDDDVARRLVVTETDSVTDNGPHSALELLGALDDGMRIVRRIGDIARPLFLGSRKTFRWHRGLRHRCLRVILGRHRCTVMAHFRGLDQGSEQRVRPGGARTKLRVGLGADIEGVRVLG